MPDRTLSPEDLRAWQLAREQEPAGAEMRAWEPSPLERQRFAITDFLEDKGFSSDRYRARQLAEDLTFLSEFIPGFGDVQGVREGAHTWGEGDRMLGGIMMAASFMPFKSGSILIKPFKALQDKIDKLKFKRKREVINLPYDQTPARRSIDRIDNEIRGLTRQQRKLVEEAPPDQLVKPGQDVVPSGGGTGGTGGTGGGAGGARPVAGEYIPRGESREIADMTMDELADVMSGVRLGVPSTPTPRQLEQDNMLKRLQNLEMYRDRPSRKLKNR